MKKFKERKLGKKEHWNKKCSCGHFIPDEYKQCDFCLLKDLGLDCLFPIFPEEQVVRAIRHLQGEIFVRCWKYGGG